jgi:DNA polymerase (family 10)
VKISINPDAHDVSHISDIKYGVGMARKGWLEAGDVLNVAPVDEFLALVNARR